METKKLFKHQKEAVEKLRTGSILCGGVGSGKSLTALVYFYKKECGGLLDDETEEYSPLKRPKDLYIITTAAKRDTLDWERECANLRLSKDRSASISGVKVVVDSWNNIKKYIGISGAFFIFDEQRLVGSGAWVKAFLKITRSNNWVLLSATPGDTWLDYAAVFIANGFYKNRSEFIRTHVVYNNFTKYPKIDHFIETSRLKKLKDSILVLMPYEKKTEVIDKSIICKYDSQLFEAVQKKRWNPYANKPIKDISEYCHILRKVVNSDPSRLEKIKELITKHRKLIIFYNFNYELDILRKLKEDKELGFAEYNGHKHERIPKTERWVYLVQYISGAEGWNCIETNALVFYSQNYSFRMQVQAAGRINRLNTPFSKLYYYHFRSSSSIDNAIYKALLAKEDFNELKFMPTTIS